MRRELTAVSDHLRQPLFDGFAIHHLGSWRTMPPVMDYSRPADTQLISRNLVPDTTSAAASSLAS